MIILLHSVQLPQNLGAVARIMGNFALHELRLINPQVSQEDSLARAVSAGAETILKNAKVFDSLSSATRDLHTLVGTCADVRTGIRFYTHPDVFFKEHSVHCKEVSQTQLPLTKLGMLFGPERTGLSQEDLSHCHATIQIPVNPDFSSMNLSHAVAIISYAWFTTLHKKEKFTEKTVETGSTQVATQGERDAFLKTLEGMLDDVNYWRVLSKKPLMLQNLRNLFSRCALTRQEIQTLLGMFQKLQGPSKTK